MYVCPRTRGPLKDWKSVHASVTYPVVEGVAVLVSEPRAFMNAHRKAFTGNLEISGVDAPDPITPHLPAHLLGAPGGLGQWFTSLGDTGPDAVVAGMASRHAPAGAALDVGCGVAPMARRMIALGRETYAFDYSPDAVFFARGMLLGGVAAAAIPTHKAGLRRVKVPFTPIPRGLNLAIADAAQPPFAVGSFAWVHMGDVLDYCGESMGEILVASAELVAPGGLLTLSTGFNVRGTPSEAKPPPEEELLEALDSLGFTVVEQLERVPHVRRDFDRSFRVRFMFCVAARRR